MDWESCSIGRIESMKETGPTTSDMEGGTSVTRMGISMREISKMARLTERVSTLGRMESSTMESGERV